MGGEPRYGKWPGWIKSYDGDGRTARVHIDGITDGTTVYPLAEFEYPIGDRSVADDSKDHTEIRVLAGDPVWIEFMCGDERFPIITGYRNPRQGNPTNWRRWRHLNVEITADDKMVLNATDLEIRVAGNMTTTVGGDQTTTVTGAQDVSAGTSTHQAGTHQITAQTTIAGAIATTAGPGGSGANLQGPVNVQGGTLTHNGTNVGDTHTHTERGDGAEVSPPH